MSDLPSFDDSVLGPLLDRVSEGVAVAVPGPWRVVCANRALAEWLGKTADELRGSPLENLFRPESRAEAVRLADAVGRGTAPQASMKAHLQAVDASSGAAEVQFCRVVSGDHVLVGIVVRRGVRGPADVQAEAERRDPLTGLRDRQFLMLRLSALLRGERSGDHQFAVLFVDLDNFKLVNDAHGHLMGDRVLREVARRLTGCVRDGDQVVRFGGDEFVVLVEGVTGTGKIESIVSRIHAAVEKPIVLPEGEFSLSLSIGVAMASPDHHSPEDLLRDADRAMYAAKRMRNGASSFPAAN